MAGKVKAETHKSEPRVKGRAVDLTDHVQKAQQQAERTMHLVEQLESGMKKTESTLHAAEENLHQTKKKARRLHRGVRRRAG
jgi:peptidoglycan hydrolase CwlO-like protein